MRRLTELTQIELLEMTPEGFDILLELECAHEGIPFLPTKPEKDERPRVKPSVTLYDIQLDNVYFSHEDAVKLITLANSFTRYNSTYLGHYYSGPRYTKEIIEDTCIKSVSFFTKEEAEEELNYEESYKTQTKAQKDAEEEYSRILEERSVIETSIREAVYTAESENYERLSANDRWEMYLKMADNNRNIAKSFYIKTYGQESYDKYISIPDDAKELTDEEASGMLGGRLD